MLQQRLMEKKRELLRRQEFDEATDSIVGIVVTHLSGMAERCSNDLAARRKIDAVVHQVRREIAEHRIKMTDAAAVAGCAEDCCSRGRRGKIGLRLLRTSARK
jgi:hypothetical protein